MFRRLACTAIMMIAALTAFSAGGENIRIPLPPKEDIAKLPKDGGAEFNRLVFEPSPYLRQHARNPVDWYPWGDVAFDVARDQDKPIFLSIGYTTCHWCHVMEHESFEDDEVAKLMNDAFVCIKVDREERPDIDNVYMTVTQALTGSGGWPMTVVMTPEKKPFFAGTYFPKSGRGGRPGMMELVPQISALWQDDRDKLLKAADAITKQLKTLSSGTPGDGLGLESLDLAFRQLKGRFDSDRGGFGQRPKFPVPHNLAFLLRYADRTDNAEAVEMAVKTLTAMRHGGIYDHVGFGFHRYSTDPDWLVPHFEKMLYDQALLAIAYTEAWQVTGDPLFKQTVREILTYVQRDMTSPGGGFYSAEDADSEGEEGLFYLWKPKEIIDIVGDVDGGKFLEIFNITEDGNFRDESTRRQTGRNIPHLKKSIVEIAAAEGKTMDSYLSWIDDVRRQLFNEREKRIHPQKDDKVLTDWNGLMIAAFAKAGQAFRNSDYTQAAKRAADFVLETLQDDQGRLLKRYCDGEAGLPAHLEDYAFFVWGLIDLYEATLEAKYLAEAVRLNDYMLEHFWDADKGALFMVADTSEQLLVRSKEIYDGAIPSGNSVATLNLVRLARLTANTDYEKKAYAIVRGFSGGVKSSPGHHTQLMIGLDFLLGPANEIVVVGKPLANDTWAMLRAVREKYLPRKVLIFRAAAGDAAISKLAPYIADMDAIDGAATAYVCQNQACDLPTTDIEQMMKTLTAKE
jgi:uncharacterized protein YyaL (SSP411 family)